MYTIPMKLIKRYPATVNTKAVYWVSFNKAIFEIRADSDDQWEVVRRGDNKRIGARTTLREVKDLIRSGK